MWLPQVVPGGGKAKNQTEKDDEEMKSNCHIQTALCCFGPSSVKTVFVKLSAGHAWEGWKLRHHKGYTPIKMASVTAESHCA